jgi:hypothetical protein
MYTPPKIQQKTSHGSLQTYTFAGTQGYNPFSVEVIASSEEEARSIALVSVDTANGKWPKIGQTTKSHPLDPHIGCYCAEVEQFGSRIFCDPRSSENLTFEEWIKVVKCTVKPFNPYVVRIYSCLDG